MVWFGWVVWVDCLEYGVWVGFFGCGVWVLGCGLNVVVFSDLVGCF